MIAGAGSNNTIETVRLVEAAEAAGADAALVVTPYYNKPTQAGLVAHFPAAAEVGPAHRDLQHPRPLGRGHDARDDGRAGAASA